MPNLNLQNPQRKKWPDYFGEKTRERIAIESNPAVQSLLSCGQLLNKELNLLLYKLQIASRHLDSLLSPSTFNIDTDGEIFRSRVSDEISKIKNELSGKAPGELNKVINLLTSRIIKEVELGKSKKKWEEIKEISNNIEDTLSTYCKKNEPSIEILTHRNFYVCGTCFEIFKKGNFQSGSCNCGQSISSVRQTDQKIIASIDPVVSDFVNKNMWLEHGIEKIFSRLDYNTVCGAYIMGSSGVSHEIDILAENYTELKRVVVECKNTEINIDHIFKLYGEMSDLGCVHGFIISTSAIPPKERKQILKLASSKNIKIIEAVLEFTSKELEDKLKN